MNELSRIGYNKARAKVSDSEQTDNEINRISNKFVAAQMIQLLIRKGMAFLIPSIAKFLEEYGNMHPVDFGEKLLQILNEEMSK